MGSRPTAALPPLLKQLNERTVLETIRSAAPISRAEISRRAGISKPTVSMALQSLLDAGLVREAREGPDGPRYGATFFEAVEDAALVLGLDLGARFLRGAVCDLAGRVRARQDVELAEPRSRPSVEEAVDSIVALRDSLLAAAGRSADLLDGAVVGVPGAVDPVSGRVRLAENVRGLEGLDLAAELERRLALRVTIENDINLAALGERWQGVARGVDDFAFLSVGTGLGAGIVLGGRLQRGRNGVAGELDLLAAGRADELDPSAGALSTYAAELVATHDGTELGPPFDARAVFAAARAGDEAARAVVAEEARRIAQHVVPVSAVADVGLIVLGGGIGANGDLLLEPVRQLLGVWLPFPPEVQASALGDAAVLTGALSVGREAALDNVLARRRAAAAPGDGGR